jgi:hypothetical protein
METSEIILNKISSSDKVTGINKSELDLILKNNIELNKLICYYAGKYYMNTDILNNKMRNNFYTLYDEKIKIYDKKRKIKQNLTQQIEIKKNQLNLYKQKRIEINSQKKKVINLLQINEKVDQEYLFKMKCMGFSEASLENLSQNFLVGKLVSDYKYIKKSDEENILSENNATSEENSAEIENYLEKEKYLKLPIVSNLFLKYY